MDVQAAMDEINLVPAQRAQSDALKPCRNAIKIMVPSRCISEPTQRHS